MTLVHDSSAIAVAGLGKRYDIGATPGSGRLYERLARVIGSRGGAPPDPHPTVWALRDVTFEVPPGQVVGVLGRNGSGKSTLMKILARITAPTEGVAQTAGRVGALLEVGTGFHPELSGRDNITLSGAILGMSKRDIEAVFDQIVVFSEIGRFLDTPVKHYSSGMFLRLAFSVSVHMAAEIMLIDEVLAVGDAAFQLKCQQRIREAVARGRTVLFVSHNVASVVALCDRAIVLEEGRLHFDGPATDAVEFYTSKILGMGPSETARAKTG